MISKHPLKTVFNLLITFDLSMVSCLVLGVLVLLHQAFLGSQPTVFLSLFIGFLKMHIRRIVSHIQLKSCCNLKFSKFFIYMYITWNEIVWFCNFFKILNEFLAFCNKRKSTNGPDSPWARADNFHLLYGRDFDGITVGMANVKAMCGDRSGGVNQVSYLLLNYIKLKLVIKLIL